MKPGVTLEPKIALEIYLGLDPKKWTQGLMNIHKINTFINSQGVVAVKPLKLHNHCDFMKQGFWVKFLHKLLK